MLWTSPKATLPSTCYLDGLCLGSNTWVSSVSTCCKAPFSLFAVFPTSPLKITELKNRSACLVCLLREDHPKNHDPVDIK